jgi:hypothetical protein
MIETSIATTRRGVDISLLLPFVWLAIVVVASTTWILPFSSPPRSVPTSVWGYYLFWQSGVLAASVFMILSAVRRRWSLAALGLGLTLLVVGLEMINLPLELYPCSEWVRIARETGVFTLW